THSVAAKRRVCRSVSPDRDISRGARRSATAGASHFSASHASCEKIRARRSRGFPPGHFSRALWPVIAEPSRPIAIAMLNKQHRGCIFVAVIVCDAENENLDHEPAQAHGCVEFTKGFQLCQIEKPEPLCPCGFVILGDERQDFGPPIERNEMQEIAKNVRPCF